MPIPLALMAGAAAAPVIGGVLGNVLSGGDRSNAADAIHNYYNMVNQLQLPEIDKMRLALTQYQSAGELTPEQEQDILLKQQDAMQDINLDPRLKKAQMDQLETLQKLGDTGVTPVEQAELNKVRRLAAADNQARMQQMLEDQQRRGVGSSEAAMAARLISGQSAANRQSEEQDRLMAMAFQRALEAKSGAAGIAGSMEGADYGRQSDLAKALNAREYANVQQQTGTQQRNIDRANQAMQLNLQQKQGLANANVDLGNKQQQYNKELQQQNYENQLRKMGMLGEASKAKADIYGNQANSTANMWAGIGSGVGKGLGGMALAGKGDSDVVSQSFDPNPNSASRKMLAK